MILAQLVSTGTLTHPNPSKWIFIHSGWASWETFFTMLVWVWSLGILRGIQKVTVAGVVGNWYFNRHEPVRPSIVEITSSSFSRAIGPSIGTIIAASFLLSLFETIAILARKMRNVVRSSQLPGFLHPISIIAPLLGFIASTLEIFNGWVLTWAGLTGDDLISSAKKARELVRMNGTLGLIDSEYYCCPSSFKD